MTSPVSTFPTLPSSAIASYNRCNLPARIIGSLAFQQWPQPLFLDGVQAIHGEFFTSLEVAENPLQRALMFQDYMASAFLLDDIDQAGFNPNSNHARPKANYLRLLRGWMFDSQSQEAAVLKGWVESRFGLRTRFHGRAIRSLDSEAYLSFQESVARGLYNTNALEAQLDLLYSFCQYEVRRRWPQKTKLALYRGFTGWHEQEILGTEQGAQYSLLLNNVNSFASSQAQVENFGDCIIKVSVPIEKLLYFPGLISGVLPSEDEHMVLGGLYRVQRLA